MERASDAPKGSKLDAAKAVEYQATISDAASWVTTGWAHWVVTGRILPERCDVNIASVVSHGVGAGGRYRLNVQVTRSLIFATCLTERTDHTAAQIVDVVRSVLAFPVDYLAFLNRGAYEVVLDLSVEGATGQPSPVSVSEPIFDAPKSGWCFAEKDNSSVAIPYGAASKAYTLPTALHDLTQAVRYPRRTFEHCRMAVEVIRGHFDPPAIKGHDKRWHAGEVAMCAALKVKRSSLLSLERVAARSRHGDLILSIDWGLRKKALELAWEIVARFATYLETGTPGPWAEIDLRVEE